MKAKSLGRARHNVQRAEFDLDTQPLPLTWVSASYRFHTFAYRDPRTAFSSGQGLPVVSPTAVLLGIASTLFQFGKAEEAQRFLQSIHICRAVVDPPDGVIFFRAFHQLRRYYSTTKGKAERAGLTNVNQGTREYGLVQGLLTVFVAVPKDLVEAVKLALRNRDHVGTHDSLCSLEGDVAVHSEPPSVIYLSPEQWRREPPKVSPITILMLSRFKGQALKATVGRHWWLAGDNNTEKVPYVVAGAFTGTTKGKIYRKRDREFGPALRS